MSIRHLRYWAHLIQLLGKSGVWLPLPTITHSQSCRSKISTRAEATLVFPWHLILSYKTRKHLVWSMNTAERVRNLISALPCDSREVTSLLQVSSSLFEKEILTAISNISSNSQILKFLFVFDPDLDNYFLGKIFFSSPLKKIEKRSCLPG